MREVAWASMVSGVMVVAANRTERRIERGMGQPSDESTADTRPQGVCCFWWR